MCDTQNELRDDSKNILIQCANRFFFLYILIFGLGSSNYRCV